MKTRGFEKVTKYMQVEFPMPGAQDAVQRRL